ncbi:MAG: ribosomal-processing cysteine protease Prp [Spirochaetota bacterium]|nr:ribosomal-processing cysteine protease Prp [Spirochaetota bacterium]
MIRLTIEDNGTTFSSFIVEGHSTVGKKGNDILCAGVSALTQAIVISIKTILKLNVMLEKRDGYIYCEIPSSMEKQEKEGIDLLVMTLISGFQDLKNQYPKEIDIVWHSE